MKVYDMKAPKKAANLSLNSDLLAQAKALNINISSTVEKSLAEEVRKHKEAAWLKENKEAIEEQNRFIKKHGLFSDKYRVF
nr:type II toxin-antitoxin system CcdA family antitoxin [Ghiorsea bivora]